MTNQSSCFEAIVARYSQRRGVYSGRIGEVNVNPGIFAVRILSSISPDLRVPSRFTSPRIKAVTAIVWVGGVLESNGFISWTNNRPIRISHASLLLVTFRRVFQRCVIIVPMPGYVPPIIPQN